VTAAADPQPGLHAGGDGRAGMRSAALQAAVRNPWWTLPFIGLAAMLPLIVRRVGDPDYWWHFRTGQWMVDNGAFARHDLYTYTIAGAPWTDHEYLSQLLYYVLTRIGGLLAVSIFFGAAVWAGFLAVFARIRQRTYAPVVAGAALLLGAGAGFPVWGPRPQMFDFIFGAIELYWLERFLSGRSRVAWFLPVLIVPWANLHGGFVFGFFFLALAIVAVVVRWIVDRDRLHLRAVRALLLIALVSGLAALLTPYGPSLYQYVWKTQFSSQLSGFVREWQSPDFHALNMLPFGLMLLLVLIGFVWRRPQLHDTLFVAGSAVLALRAWLFIPMFVAAATPVLAWQWSEPWVRLRTWLKTTSLGRPREWAGEGLLMLAGLALVGGIGVSAYTLRGQTTATRVNYPVAAADWLAAHPTVGTRMFNEYAWGGYLAYRFYPTQTRRVFIYGESELMGDTLLAQYADVNNLRSDWSKILDDYRVDYVVFPTDTPLVSALDISPTWQRVYSDSMAVIFVRNGTTPTG
jgi:hypothetical protein